MQPEDYRKAPKSLQLIDYFLYSLAGGVMAVMSFSFFLWLRF